MFRVQVRDVHVWLACFEVESFGLDVIVGANGWGVHVGGCAWRGCAYLGCMLGVCIVCLQPHQVCLTMLSSGLLPFQIYKFLTPLIGKKYPVMSWKPICNLKSRHMQCSIFIMLYC